jgi:hypothetical protein
MALVSTKTKKIIEYFKDLQFSKSTENQDLAKYIDKGFVIMKDLTTTDTTADDGTVFEKEGSVTFSLECFDEKDFSASIKFSNTGSISTSGTHTTIGASKTAECSFTVHHDVRTQLTAFGGPLSAVFMSLKDKIDDKNCTPETVYNMFLAIVNTLYVQLHGKGKELHKYPIQAKQTFQKLRIEPIDLEKEAPKADLTNPLPFLNQIKNGLKLKEVKPVAKSDPKDDLRAQLFAAIQKRREAINGKKS